MKGNANTDPPPHLGDVVERGSTPPPGRGATTGGISPAVGPTDTLHLSSSSKVAAADDRELIKELQAGSHAAEAAEAEYGEAVRAGRKEVVALLNASTLLKPF